GVRARARPRRPRAIFGWRRRAEAREADDPCRAGTGAAERAAAQTAARFLHRLSRAPDVQRAQDRSARVGETHVSAAIGCHAFATLPPFNMGNTILGYGMGLASSNAVAPAFQRRVVSILGDGGFWHSGLTAGVANAVYNKQDSVLIVLENFY